MVNDSNIELESPEGKIHLLRLVETSRLLQVYGLQITRDAMFLAIQQVNETRLALLENPEEVRTLDAVVFDLMIGMVFTPIIGSAVKSLVKAVLNPVLRTRLAFNFLSKTERGVEVAARIQYSISKHKDKLATDLLKSIDEKTLQSLYKTDVYKFIETSYNKSVEVVSKLSEVGDSGNISAAARAQDSAGVRLLGAITQFVGQQVFAVESAHSLFKIWVQNDTLSAEEKSDLQKLLMKNIESAVRPKMVAMYRDQMRLHFETLIWVMLYWDGITHPGWESKAGGKFLILGMDEKLSKYIARRLINEKGVTFYDEASARVRIGGVEEERIWKGAIVDAAVYLLEVKENLQNPGTPLARKIFKGISNPIVHT